MLNIIAAETNYYLLPFRHFDVYWKLLSFWCVLKVSVILMCIESFCHFDVYWKLLSFWCVLKTSVILIRIEKSLYLLYSENITEKKRCFYCTLLLLNKILKKRETLARWTGWGGSLEDKSGAEGWGGGGTDAHWIIAQDLDLQRHWSAEHVW